LPGLPSHQHHQTYTNLIFLQKLPLVLVLLGPASRLSLSSTLLLQLSSLNAIIVIDPLPILIKRFWLSVNKDGWVAVPSIVLVDTAKQLVVDLPVVIVITVGAPGVIFRTEPNNKVSTLSKKLTFPRY
jgi:hypothetical protein